MKKSIKNLLYILLTILSLIACTPQINPPTNNQSNTLKLLYWQAPTILNVCSCALALKRNYEPNYNCYIKSV